MAGPSDLIGGPVSLETAWAGGLFEGEGCITGRPGTPALKLKMTDRDVVERFQAAVGGRGGIHARASSCARWKPTWEWSVGAEHDVFAVMGLLLPWLGERRRARWQLALDAVARKHEARRKECLYCGEPFIAHPTGRPQVYCRKRCQRDAVNAWRREMRAARARAAA